MVNASDRIAQVFDRLLKDGHERIGRRLLVEQVVYYLVVARCEKDMACFESVFEQGLDDAQLRVLINGLHAMDESELANLFTECLESLEQEGFYPRRDWSRVSSETKAVLSSIGQKVGERLWTLDDKLCALLDSKR